MAMLHELHNQGQDKFVYTCNNCKAHVETRYHCTVCDDFDLCVTCFEKDGHPHKMEKLGLDIDDGSSPADQKQANPQEAWKLSIQRCIQSLVHACQCRDANCRLPSCQRMKRVVQHTKVCQRKANGTCPICKQLAALCCYHAKYCQETKCPVPFCSNIRLKMKQQQLLQRLQQAKLLRRRMAVMNTTRSGGGGGGGGLSGEAVSPGGAGPPAPMAPQPTHQSLGLKPGSQTPPANVLQVVKQVQEEAARQQAPQAALSYPGKVVPQQQVMPPPGQRGGLQQVPGPPLIPPIDQWTPRDTTPTTPGQRPGMLPGGGSAMPPGAAAVPAMRGQAQTPAVQKQVLQQLLQTLKNPTTPDQQQQILHILKTNPQLMAAFIKQRQQAQQQQAAAAAAAAGGGAVQQNQAVGGGAQGQQQTVGQQQIQQHLLQQQNRLQHMQMLSQQQQQQQVNQPTNQQPNPQHPNWYKHQQLLAMQQRQQQQQQQQQFPPGYQTAAAAAGQAARLGGVRYQGFGDGQYSAVSSKPVASPVMGPPMQQTGQPQMMRSPPPIRSPQPNPSPRPVPSPRPGPSPTTDMMLSHISHHQSPAQPSQQDPNDLTPQDQLSKFVEQL